MSTSTVQEYQTLLLGGNRYTPHQTTYLKFTNMDDLKGFVYLVTEDVIKVNNGEVPKNLTRGCYVLLDNAPKPNYSGWNTKCINGVRRDDIVLNNENKKDIRYLCLHYLRQHAFSSTLFDIVLMCDLHVCHKLYKRKKYTDLFYCDFLIKYKPGNDCCSSNHITHLVIIQHKY